MLDGGEDPGPPGLEERFLVALQHLDMNVEEYGESSGVIQMRKHLGWYTRFLVNGAELRRKLFEARSRKEVRVILQDYLESNGHTYRD